MAKCVDGAVIAHDNNASTGEHMTDPQSKFDRALAPLNARVRARAAAAPQAEPDGHQPPPDDIGPYPGGAPQAEPVAWMDPQTLGIIEHGLKAASLAATASHVRAKAEAYSVPLYTTPQPQAEPVNAELLAFAKMVVQGEGDSAREMLAKGRAAIARAEAQKPQRLTDAEIDAGVEAWFDTMTTHPGAEADYRIRMRAALRAMGITGDAT